MTRRAVIGGVVVVLASSVVAWSLALPQNSLTATTVRALADCAAVMTLGLVIVPMLDVDRYRAELAGRAVTPLAVSSAVWLVAELSRLVAAAAQAAGVSVARIGVRALADFAVHTTVGRAELFSGGAAAVVLGAVMVAPRSASFGVATAGAAAAGLTARTLAGHLSESPVGGVAVAVHALAAAVWCGALAALVLTVAHRGQWARVLPRFSQLSLWCVVVLLAGGVAGGVATLEGPTALYETGYGRVLSAKIATTAVLMVVAWRNRAGWLPAARSHRATAVVSRSRSLFELAIMAVALTLAAALAVTG